MIVEIIAVVLLARYKRFRLRYLFHTWTFYPILLMQLLMLVAQLSLGLGWYGLVPLAPYLEPAVILSFLFALLAYSLYKPAMAGCGCILAGTVLNKLAIAQNGGHMPVYPTLSYLTGYVKPATFGTLDTLHVLGDAGTKLKFLTDYIDYGYSILSPGDVFIHLYVCIMLYALIRAVNLRHRDRETTLNLPREA